MEEEHNEKVNNLWRKQFPKKKREQVEQILDTKLVATRSKSYKLYFIKWKYLPDSYNSWIMKLI